MARVMVVFGGRSGEHEVSLASARAIMDALGGRHEVVPVGITREGGWISSGDPMRELESRSGAMIGAGGASDTGLLAKSGQKIPAALDSADVVF
ncbi:MAG TPA: D-alanine--D-alanine ligase A, partial [Rubrobacteraceae bacterium]|nr:D-alanine--D-alanine ligase A [Rubrobacteraceae bacterium]